MSASSNHLSILHPHDDRIHDSVLDKDREYVPEAPQEEVHSPKRSFTISDSSPFIRQRKKSRGSPFLFSPRDRADSNATNGSLTQIYEWSPISASMDIMTSPVISVSTIRKCASAPEFHPKSPRSRNNSIGMVSDSSHEIMTPIMKHVDNELDVLHEVSFSSHTDTTSPERAKSQVPTFESIINDENLEARGEQEIDHPHFLPPNSDEFLMLPHIRPVKARRDRGDDDDHVCPTPTAFLAELKIV